MYQVIKSYDFCAAHRLEGHPKCSRLHGHNYHVEVTVGGQGVAGGMLIDFGEVKAALKEICEPWDHRYLVSQDNINSEDPYWMYSKDGHVVELSLDQSTAESLAKLIYDRMSTHLLPWGVHVIQVAVDETPSSRAVYREEL
jgi:6-pyruvoyltetrahydropterin/6-carboxytetrahydropterin synthase